MRTLDDFGTLLEHGADKVSINTAALDEPGIVEQAARRFGAQCVVVSIDYAVDAAGRARVMRDHGQRDTGHEVVAWSKRVVERGAGELLLADVHRDGSGLGLSWGVARAVTAVVDVPVVISGGCGLAEHFVEGFRDGGAEGVAAGTFFCFRDQSPMQTRAHIRNAGIAIRMET